MSAETGCQKSLTRLQTFLIFLLGLLLWLWMFGVKYGTASINPHGFDYYLLVRYFMDNLTRGVFPLWDPFGAWGRPDEIDQRFLGEYNPFLWVYSFLTACHVPRLWAFLGYAFSYFLAGAAALYLLAKRLFGPNRLFALTAALLYMFSSPVFSIFTNFVIHLLLVPVFWFFYYLLVFSQEPRRHFFLGLIFSLAVIAITYMPFYFLVVLTSFFIGVVFLFSREATDFLSRTFRFYLANKRFVAFCLMFLALSFVPGVRWFMGSSHGEVIVPWRLQSLTDAHTGSMDYVPPSMIAQVMNFQGLFTHLEQGQHLVFFVSFFVYILFLLSITCRINRLQILLMGMGCWVFFHFLGELTPVHSFLSKHVYVYHLFRNLNYFVDFLVPIVILFFVGQLRQLLRVLQIGPEFLL